MGLAQARARGGRGLTRLCLADMPRLDAAQLRELLARLAVAPRCGPLPPRTAPAGRTGTTPEGGPSRGRAAKGCARAAGGGLTAAPAARHGARAGGLAGSSAWALRQGLLVVCTRAPGACMRGRSRRRGDGATRLLALDLSSCGAAGDAALAALAPPQRAAAPAPRSAGRPDAVRGQRQLERSDAAHEGAGGSDAAGAPSSPGAGEAAPPAPASPDAARSSAGERDANGPPRGQGAPGAARAGGADASRAVPGGGREGGGAAGAEGARPELALAGLSELRLTCCCRPSVEGLVGLAPALTRVRVLCLDHVEALRRPPPAAPGPGPPGAAPPAPGAHALFAALAAAGGAPDLAELRLDGARLDDAGAETLAGALGPALRTLSLVDARGLGDVGMRALAAACPGLQTLCVGGKCGAWTERGALPAFAALTELRLVRRSVEDGRALAAALAPHARTLRRAPRGSCL